jgi:hypothetical protein
MPHATYGGMAHNVVKLMVVLANLAFWLESWRVLCLSRSSFEGSGVGASLLVTVRTPARGLGRRRTRGCTTADMAVSRRPGLPQCWEWRCSAWDGGIVTGMAAQGRTWRRRRAPLVQRHGTISGGCRVGGNTPFEGSTVLFWEGGDVEEVREWAAQCHEMTPAFPHSSRTTSGMAAQRGLVEQRRNMIPRGVRGPAWRGFAFDPGARCVPEN